MNVVALVNILKCWTADFCDLASESPDIIMHQLKSIYNTPFKGSHSYPIHTCLPTIAGNGMAEDTYCINVELTA